MKRQLQTNITVPGVSMLAVQEVGTLDIVIFHKIQGFPILTELQSLRPLNSDQELGWVVADWVKRVRDQDPDGIRKLAEAL